jgi:hypothetical protein
LDSFELHKNAGLKKTVADLVVNIVIEAYDHLTQLRV